jgi:hypothetical protein
VEGKMQKLAGGQIVLNVLSFEMPDDVCDELLRDSGFTQEKIDAIRAAECNES